MSGLRELTRNRKVDVALHNEMLTRERVDRLERQVADLGAWFDELARRDLWGRLHWVLTGR
jgi:hypothetical protein